METPQKERIRTSFAPDPALENLMAYADGERVLTFPTYRGTVAWRRVDWWEARVKKCAVGQYGPGLPWFVDIDGKTHGQFARRELAVRYVAWKCAGKDWCRESAPTALCQHTTRHYRPQMGGGTLGPLICKRRATHGTLCKQHAAQESLVNSMRRTKHTNT